MTRQELFALYNTLNRISVCGKQNMSDLVACISLVEREIAKMKEDEHGNVDCTEL